MHAYTRSSSTAGSKILRQNTSIAIGVSSIATTIVVGLVSYNGVRTSPTSWSAGASEPL